LTEKQETEISGRKQIYSKPAQNKTQEILHLKSLCRVFSGYKELLLGWGWSSVR
jgi:hypothetical protein